MLYDSHRQEWLDSCVSSELIALNVWTIEDSAEADELLNKNTNRRWRHSDIVPGWAVAGISLSSGDRTYQGAQFKPDTPVTIGERTLKYLSASGEDSAPLLLDTPKATYWQDITKDATRQIILTEGAKKAGAAMTVGCPTISIPGVYAGQKKGRLKPELKPFATLGRPWVIGFDADWRTNRNVFHALDRQARLLASTGGTIRFLDIPLETKGLDDYIAAHGPDDFLVLIDQALTYEEWKELCKDIWDNQPVAQLHAVQDSEEAEIAAEENKYIAAEVDRLTQSVGEQFTITELLPEALATPLIKVAQRLNVPPAAFLSVLLPICSGRIRVGCEVEIDPSTDYTVSPMLWACTLGESGSAKSVMLKLMFKPLLRLQKEADKQHRLAEASHKSAMTEWIKSKGEKNGIPCPEEPKAREFYVDDSTMETLADIITSWPAFGLPLVQDELAGLFNGLNQYKSGGKGSDRQRLLSLYDGGPIKKNRKGARLSQDRTALSITGTTQPHVLLQLMRGVTEADDGLWARFFWAVLPPSEMPPPGGGARLDISPMLEQLYRKLEEQTPHTFTLTKEAAAEWRKWHLYTERARMSEQHPTLRAIYPKARERAARVALVVHFIEWAMQNKTPTDQISGATMAAAVRFVKWTIGQALLIYADAGVADNSDSSKIAKLLKAKSGQTLTSVEVSKFFGSRIKAVEAKRLMQKIHNLGFGEVSKKGKSVRIKLQNHNKESEASEADSTQTHASTENNPPQTPEADVRRVRRILPVGDVTVKTPKQRKSVKRSKVKSKKKTPHSEKTPQNPPQNSGDCNPVREGITGESASNASNASTPETQTRRGIQEKTPQNPENLYISKKKGEDIPHSWEGIEVGEKFVLGGEATKYPSVMKISDSIWTCTKVTSTKIHGHDEGFIPRDFPKSWCFHMPSSEVV